MKSRLLLYATLLVLCLSVFGSHFNISMPQIESIKESNASVSFNVKWDGAWKNDINNDGAWVFGKYKDPSGKWMPMKLTEASKGGFLDNAPLPDGFSTGRALYGPELGMWIPETKLGIFLFPKSGKGNIFSEDVMISWQIPDEIASVKIGNIDFKLFGLEMVYVPEGQHYVGDPDGAENLLNCFYEYPDGGAFLIDSEKSIIVDAKDGHMYCDQDNDRSRDEVPFEIPESFNKGFKAFWLMKYEMSSLQYVNFLNTLTRKQQNPRTKADVSTDAIANYHVLTDTPDEYLRQSIVCQKDGNGTEEPVEFFTYAPARACNVICWGDVCAFADWAGLRPMTELEYEKACRGPNEALPTELAWSTANIGRVNTFSGADGSGYEKKVPTTGLVNCCYGGGIAPFLRDKQKEPTNPGFEGPVTCGLFENTQHESIPKRENDGASYYGIMELSGNVWEPCVTVGHPKGRIYTARHGDGIIDENGYADVADWPDSTGAGAGVRGGVWVSPEAKYLAISLRFAANHTKSARRYNGGCRVAF